MSKNYKIGYNQREISVGGNISNGCINNDFSITKNKAISINKQIFTTQPKTKKKEKETNTESSMSYYFGVRLKEDMDQRPSYNRHNIKQLYSSGKTIEMIAYVQGKRKHDGKFVLYNVCTDSQFMADHVIVNPDPEEMIEIYIGQCIMFDASAYSYSEGKYGLSITNVRPLRTNKPYKYICGDVSKTNDDIVEYVFKYLYSEMPVDTIFRIVDNLATIIENYSASIYGSKKFIIGLIFNSLFLGSDNHNLSTQYDDVLYRSKNILILILSDILYTIEKYRKYCESMIIDLDDEYNGKQLFNILHDRIIRVSLLFQRPQFNTPKRDGYGKVFEKFCKANGVDLYQGESYIKDNFKRFNMTDVYSSTNFTQLAREIKEEVSVIIPDIIKHN